MFFRSRHKNRPKGGGIFAIFRLFLSLIIFAILGIGLLMAFKSFSAVDPLSVSPESIIKNILSADSLTDFISGLLSVNPSSPIDQAKKILQDDQKGGLVNSSKTNAPLQFKFAVIADSHLDSANLAKALQISKANGAKLAIGMGDFSDVGTIDELKNTKLQFDASGLNFYTTPGDHDLWDSRNKNLAAEQNFKEIFGPPYQSFSDQDVRFIIIYNSDNYLGLDDLQLGWIEDELARDQQNQPKLIFVFVSTPLYHPSSDHVMGKTNPKLKNQADHLASIFKRNRVAEVFAADTHMFSRYKDPVNDLNMTTVGAITSVKNPQTPRFVMVDVFQDGSYNVSEIEIR